MAKPINWQDFEDLCNKIWKYEFDCKTIKKNGRSGQDQYGVDVSGNSEYYKGYFGIQCKGKDDYTHAKLSEQEINTEIEKAKTFKPELKIFIFATTANKDAKIEEFIRIKDIECREAGFFQISLYSWEDITDLIKEHKPVYNWYVYDKHYSENINVTVSPICESTEEDIPLLIPKYTKQKTIYALKKPSLFGMPIDFNRMPQPKYIDLEFLPTSSRKQEDCSYVHLTFMIANTGTVSLIDCNVFLEIVSEDSIFFASYHNLFGLQFEFTEEDKNLSRNLPSLNVGVSIEMNAILKFPETIEEVTNLKDSVTIKWSFTSNQNSELIDGSFDILIKPQIVELEDICKSVYDSKLEGEIVKLKPQEIKK